jgi:tetratricopeptide (TPR) repeat protein
MPEILFRVRAVFANRLWRLGWGLLLVLELGLLAFPVLRIPGYELATGLSLSTVFAGGLLALAFGKYEATRVAERPLFEVACAVAASTLTLLAPATVTLLVAIVATALGSKCSPFSTIAFWPLIVLPSAAIVSGVGVWVGLFVRRWPLAIMAWLGVIAVSAAHTGWPIVFGPQVSAWNHLAGFLPGPIYDEELRVPSALVWFRLGSVLIAAIALLSAARRRGDRRPIVRMAQLGLAGLVLALELAGPTLGFRMSDSALMARLGGRTEGPNVVLVHPRGMAPRDVARVLGDLEFRFGQIATFVGGAPEGRVTVWWYRSAELKQKLVGAAHTQFAKPWRREIHVNESGFPHPVVKHELAHALLGPLGAKPFGVTARLFGLSPHVGIIEGMAVAADNPIDDLSLHQWTAAMKKQSMLPDVRTLLEPQGFYSAPASRAYTTAGSFLRWLGETRGPDRLRALYRKGDFEGVYGVPLAELVTSWEQFLDGVALDEQSVNQAFARFRRGSLFDRPCAREVALLTADVGALSVDDAPAALELLARCEALQPEEPGHVLSRASTLRRLGQLEEAATLLEWLLDRVQGAPSTWADAALALADLAITRGDDARAKALLTGIVERQISPSMDRTARVRLHSLEVTGAARTALVKYFANDPEAAQVHWLEQAAIEAPGDAYVAYLLGRKLHQREAFAEALPFLDRARSDAALPPSLRVEAIRLMLEASYGAGACARITSLTPILKARAQEWLERCAASGTTPQ